MDNSKEEIARGEAAKQLLDNPLLKEAFESVRSGIVRAMENSPMGDEKTHNRLAIALQVLAQVKKAISIHIETGTMASIQTRDTLAQKAKKFMRG